MPAWFRWCCLLPAVLLCCSSDPAGPDDGGGEGPAVDSNDAALENSAGRCADGKDNDHDGRTDCQDQDCWRFASCRDMGPPDKSAPDTGDQQAPKPDAPLQDEGAADALAGDAKGDALPQPDLGGPLDNGPGDAGQTCSNHHACAQGWFCYQGKCIKDPKMPVYHCGKAGCPPGRRCVKPGGKKSVCAEDKAYKCADACDCGPAHCCKGGICVKDTTDPWLPGGAAVGPACVGGKDATYCCSDPQCYPGRHALGTGVGAFRCHDKTHNKAAPFCGGAPCHGTSCNCSSGEACVDTTSSTPAGRTCMLLSGGSCISTALAESLFSFKPADLLPCCQKGCLKGSKCEVGWMRSGGRYAYQRVVGSCGSCGNGKCDEGEYPSTCKDCFCGDGECAPEELEGKPPCADCATCGNGKCDPWENPTLCSKDCSACGDGWCTGAEGITSCPKDCGGDRCLDAPLYRGYFRVCGDKVCDHRACQDPETCKTCPQDCGECSWEQANRQSTWSGKIGSLRAVWGSSASNVLAAGASLIRKDGVRWNLLVSGWTGFIYDVWGTSASNVFAATSGGILRFDGSAWSPVYTNPKTTLQGIWGTSPSHVIAVGSEDVPYTYFRAVVLRYDGKAWNVDKLANNHSFAAVWGSSATNVYAVGYRRLSSTSRAGLVMRHDGVQWSTVAVPAGTEGLADVWGTSATNVFVVGSDKTTTSRPLILRYDGKTWTKQLIPINPGSSLMSIWGSSATDVFAVGGSQVLRFDGASWSTLFYEPLLTLRLTDLWGTSATDVYAVGDRVIMRYDGKGWQDDNPTESVSLHGVWAHGASQVLAVGSHVSGLVRQGAVLRHGGASWDLTTIPPKGGVMGKNLYLYDVWAASPASAFAVGNAGQIVHFDGIAWKHFNAPTSTSFAAVWGTSATSVHAVGNWQMGVSGHPVVRFDGLKWSAVPWSAPKRNVGVWGSSASDIYLLDGDSTTVDGHLHHFDGGSVTQSLVLAKEEVVAVWGSSSTSVFALGERGTVMRFDGGKWNTVQVKAGGIFTDGWGTSATNVFATGRKFGQDLFGTQGLYTVYHYDGLVWAALEFDLREISSGSYSCPDLRAVHGTATGHVYVVGDSATVLHRCPGGKCP